MAPAKVLLLLGLAFVAIVLISSEAVSARELAETTQTGETLGMDHYGHGGHGHGGYGHGKGHGGYGYGKGHGGYGHDDGHHGHHCRHGHHCAKEETEGGKH